MSESSGSVALIKLCEKRTEQLAQRRMIFCEQPLRFLRLFG